MVLELELEVVIDDFSSLEGISKVLLGDIPTADDDVVRVNERKDFLEGSEDFLVLVETNLGGGGLGDGAVVIGSVGTLLGLPGDVMLVGENTSSQSGSVVSAEADDHDTELGDLGGGLECV